MFTAVASRSSDDSSGSDYLKLGDGESVNGVFRGEVYVFYMSWPEGGEKQVSDQPFAGASMRFRANFVVRENGRFIAKVFEFGKKTNNDLAGLAKVCNIRETKVMILRNGLKKKTTYTIMPVLNEPLNAEQIKAIEAVELVTLNGGQSATAPAKAPPKNFAPGASNEPEF